MGGEGGHDDDILTQTPRTISPEEPFTRYLQYFRDVGPFSIIAKPTSGRWDLRDFGGLSAKNSILVGGKLSSVRGHPEISPPPSSQAPHTTSKTKPPTPKSGL